VSGRVVLVSAGPGDPDLLTVRAAREIGSAEVLLYDALIDYVVLQLASPECELIDVGKRGDGTKGVAQDEIAALLIEKAQAGHYVVRLKGGDPFVFGRGGEEASALEAAGIPFEVVPGISSVIAVPAYAGIPVTDRRLSSSVAVITGHRGKSIEDVRVDWEGLARCAETLVVLMGTRWIEDIVKRIIAAGRDPETPAAAIAHGTTAQQKVVVAALHELPARMREAELHAPSVVIVGEVVRFRDKLHWYEDRPLFAKRVLVARAEQRPGELLLALRARGAEPVRVPLLAFEPPLDSEPLARALADLAKYDWLVCTSANAVRAVTPKLDPASLDQTLVACIGSATAAVARAAGLRVVAVPPGRSRPDELANEMAAIHPLDGARVLFPCAEHARPELPKELRGRGAEVDAVVAYRTVIPDGAGERLRSAAAAGLDVLTFTSPSTVDHLFELLGDAEARALCERTVLACIGPTTAERLQEQGFEAQVVSQRQTGAELVQALELWFGEHEHGVS